MNLAIAIAGGVFWFLYMALIFYSKQTPEAQVRRRLDEMIRHAENERAIIARQRRRNDPIEPSTSRSFFERVITPLIHSIVERLQALAPARIRAVLEDKIFLAGKQGVWSVKQLLAFWVVSFGAGIVFGLALSQSVPLHPLQQLTIIGLGAVMGAAFPIAVLNSKIEARKKQIRRQLPEFLDLLCVSVQAGLSFDGAVAKICGRMRGALVDEFKRMQQNVNLGMTRQYALTQMAKRINLEEIYLFTTSVIQAEKLGTSMARTLKLQADNMRERHRQYVKTQAMKAPVKIIFPMVVFIFPSIFVVLLFPSILSLMRSMGG